MNTWWLQQQAAQHWSLSLLSGRSCSVCGCEELCFDPLPGSRFFYSRGRKRPRAGWEPTGEVCLQEETDVVLGKAGCKVKSRAGAERETGVFISASRINRP